jgi:hypothetical protein
MIDRAEDPGDRVASDPFWLLATAAGVWYGGSYVPFVLAPHHQSDERNDSACMWSSICTCNSVGGCAFVHVQYKAVRHAWWPPPIYCKWSIYIVFDLYCNLLMAWTNIVSCKAVLIAQWSLLVTAAARSSKKQATDLLITFIKAALDKIFSCLFISS